jgi:hypothetical protein
VGHDVASGLFYFDEDASVGDDDGHTGDEESESEELFRRLAVLAGQDGAGESGGIEAQVALDAQQRRHHHQEAEEPRAKDHQDDQRAQVDLVVPRRRSYQNIPMGTNEWSAFNKN